MSESVFRNHYTAGRLAMAGIGPWTPLSDWMDAVFVIILETPVDDIEKLEDRLSAIDAQVDPKAARETWGQTPEQQALGGRLQTG